MSYPEYRDYRITHVSEKHGTVISCTQCKVDIMHLYTGSPVDLEKLMVSIDQHERETDNEV